MVRSSFTTTILILIVLIVQVISQQPPNNLNQLLRGSQQQINSHAGSFAPGTKMFEEAHQAWLPKIPQRDSSGLPESTAAEQMSGASFMSQPDQIANNFRNTDIIAGGSQKLRL
jgi:hypothetical protein